MSRGLGALFIAATLPACASPSARHFKSDQEAFAAALAGEPRVLGVGEAHALRGTDAIEPAVRRFTREFLPLLSGKASDLVVEILLPNAKCVEDTKAAATEQRVVTEHQAPSDQNDYVALANAARALGITPHALSPSCDDLAHIASAGPGAVTVSLDVVTRLARETLSRLVDAQASAKEPRRMIVAYGGAMHNDIAPRPELAKWSFGPPMQTLTGGRYVELDLIVREFIQDSPAWRALPWMKGFDPTAHADEVLLLAPAARSFVLIFPRSSGESPGRAAPR